MNFLKITGLALGTVSVAGGTGFGIYYADSKNRKNTPANVETEIIIEKSVPISVGDAFNDVNDLPINSDSENDQTGKLIPKKDQNFVGKIIFYKKTKKDKSTSYEVKLISTTQYERELETLNKVNNENKKVLDISGNLNSVEARKQLKEIVSKSSSFSDMKTKISEKSTEFTTLLGESIYESLKNALSD